MTATKGFILAAGFGTRLRPLTDRIPKPLVPFLGASALELALFQLAHAGIKDIAVNSHYLSEKISSCLADLSWLQGVHVFHSHEPTILGTGGCYNPLRDWLGDANLLVYNGDIISDVDLRELLVVHGEARAVATMALLNEQIPGESAVFEDRGIVLGIGGSRGGGVARNFACAQLLSRKFLDLLPREGVFEIMSKGYRPALNNGLRIAGFVHDGYWEDLRSPEIVLHAQLAALRSGDVIDRLRLREFWRSRNESWSVNKDGQLISATAHLAPGASLRGPNVVGPGCTVAAGVAVSDSVLYEGAIATKPLDQAIVWGDLEINLPIHSTE